MPHIEETRSTLDKTAVIPPTKVDQTVIPAAAEKGESSSKQATTAPASQPTTQPDIKQLVQNLQTAMSFIDRDPQLTATLNAVLDPKDPRAKFEVVRSASEAARRYGITNFEGDAITVSPAVVGPDGQIKRINHIINIDGNSLSNVGRALVTLQHEFYHIQRLENGQRAANLDVEERETFATSISAAEKLAAGMRESAKTAPRETQEQLLRIASEIDTALKHDRELLRTFEARTKK